MSYNNPFNTAIVNQEIIYGVQLYETAEESEGDEAPEIATEAYMPFTIPAPTYEEQREPCVGDLLLWRFLTPNANGQDTILCKITSVEKEPYTHGVYMEAICFVQGKTGARGAAGRIGQAGESAYQAAQKGGYTDTTAAFYSDLAAVQGLATELENLL